MRLVVLLAAVLIATLPAMTPAGAQIMRIAAIVNDEAISAFDIEQRVRLLVTTSGARPTPELLRRLESQVLNSLIEERLQLQEAKRLNIRVLENEIDESIRFIERQNRFTAGQLERTLVRAGVDFSTLLDQLRAQIAWSKLVRQRLRPTIVVGPDEIEEAMKRATEGAGRNEYLLSEIMLALDSPERRDETLRVANELVRQVRGGASFGDLARQVSQASSASASGDLGWVAQGRLPDSVERAVSDARLGEVTEPVVTRDGVFILLVRDRRTAGDPGDTRVRLKQVLLPLRSDAAPEAVRSQTALATQISASVNSCDEMDRVIADMASRESGDLGSVRLNDVPEALRRGIEALPIGKASAPIRTDNGIHVLTVCERDAANTLAQRQAIENGLGQTKLDMLARRYLRDLRRDGLIEIR
jgi:peptidyl-prolyl cis-trans isomerase SurA